MNPIIDQKGKAVAYLYNKLLLDEKQQKVIGVVLGNCVFSYKAELVGKYFNNTFRNLDGDIVALLSNEYNLEPLINQLEIINDVWKILMKIKNHVCVWIPEHSEWTKQSFSEFLSSKEIRCESEMSYV